MGQGPWKKIVLKSWNGLHKRVGWGLNPLCILCFPEEVSKNSLRRPTVHTGCECSTENLKGEDVSGASGKLTIKTGFERESKWDMASNKRPQVFFFFDSCHFYLFCFKTDLAPYL